MEWTDDAVEEACSLLFNLWEHRVQKSHMVAALNAAVKSQGWDGHQPSEAWLKAFTDSVDKTMAFQISHARSEALEEAAKVLDKWSEELWSRNNCYQLSPNILDEAAIEIRALKDKPANQTDGGE